MIVHSHTGRTLLISTVLQADLEEEKNVNEEGSNFTMEALQHQVSHVMLEPALFKVLRSSAFLGSRYVQPPDRALRCLVAGGRAQQPAAAVRVRSGGRGQVPPAGQQGPAHPAADAAGVLHAGPLTPPSSLPRTRCSSVLHG